MRVLFITIMPHRGCGDGLDTMLTGLRTVSATIFVTLMILVSAAAGTLFGYRLGHGLEAWVYAAVALAAEGTKWLLPDAISAAWRRGQYMRVLLGTVTVLTVMGYSFAAAIGLSSFVRTAETVMVGASKTVLASIRADIQRETDRLTALGSPRPIGTIDSLIDAAKQDRRWSSTNQCSDATAKASREFCADLAKLEAERGSAVTADGIRAELGKLKAKLESAGAEAPPVAVADEQAKALSSLLGVPKDTVSMGMCLFVALLVELIATFGTYVLHSPKGSEPEPLPVTRPRRVARPQAAAPPAVNTNVAAFGTAMLRKTKDSRLTGKDIYASYLQWCQDKGETPLNQTAFGLALSWPKRKMGGRMMYLDVSIAGGAPALRVVAHNPPAPRLGRMVATA